MSEDSGKSTNAVDVVRMYTVARKFPKLVGRFPDGRPLPFGPYTTTQLIGGFLALAALYLLRGLWAYFGGPLNLVLALVITIGTVWALGRVSQTARSPLSRLTGLGRATVRPPSARIDGRSVRVRAPHAVAGLVEVVDTTSPPPVAGRERVPALSEDAVTTADLPVIESDWSATRYAPMAPPTPTATRVPVGRHHVRLIDPLDPGRDEGSPVAPATAPPWLMPELDDTATSTAGVPGSHRDDYARDDDYDRDRSRRSEVAARSPRVTAAAGTGVAALLAIANDTAHRRDQ